MAVEGVLRRLVRRPRLRARRRGKELPTAELLMRGRELIRYLRRYGEITWAEWLEDSLEAVRRDARAGVADLLEGFDGLCNLTDIYLCPEAGHCVAVEEESLVNEELLVMVSRVYQLSRDLGDFVETETFRSFGLNSMHS